MRREEEGGNEACCMGAHSRVPLVVAVVGAAPS